MRHCWLHGGPFAELLLVFHEEFCGWIDAFFRRSPHLDERAQGDEQGLRRIVASDFELPTRLPPARPLLPRQ